MNNYSSTPNKIKTLWNSLNIQDKNFIEKELAIRGLSKKSKYSTTPLSGFEKTYLTDWIDLKSQTETITSGIDKEYWGGAYWGLTSVNSDFKGQLFYYAIQYNNVNSFNFPTLEIQRANSNYTLPLTEEISIYSVPCYDRIITQLKEYFPSLELPSVLGEIYPDQIAGLFIWNWEWSQSKIASILGWTEDIDYTIITKEEWNNTVEMIEFTGNPFSQLLSSQNTTEEKRTIYYLRNYLIPDLPSFKPYIFSHYLIQIIPTIEHKFYKEGDIQEVPNIRWWFDDNYYLRCSAWSEIGSGITKVEPFKVKFSIKIYNLYN